MEKNQSIWTEDIEYPFADWQYEVANLDTLSGYWAWVAAKKEEEEFKGMEFGGKTPI